MAEENVFHYRKSVGFLLFGMMCIGLAGFLFAPMVMCRCYWNVQWMRHWWYWYVFPNALGAVMLVLGVSNLLFWFNHVMKRPYVIITDDTVRIDAETDIKIADIESAAEKNCLGCKMLCLKIKNPEQYKLSWRFKADRIFHKDYQAFICLDLIKKSEKAACREWFEQRFEK